MNKGLVFGLFLHLTISTLKGSSEIQHDLEKQLTTLQLNQYNTYIKLEATNKASFFLNQCLEKNNKMAKLYGINLEEFIKRGNDYDAIVYNQYGWELPKILLQRPH